MSQTSELALLGAAIRRLRVERGITQKALVLRAGMNTSTLARIERGRSNPLLTTLIEIADALEIPPGEMVSAAEGGEA